MSKFSPFALGLTTLTFLLLVILSESFMELLISLFVVVCGLWIINWLLYITNKL